MLQHICSPVQYQKSVKVEMKTDLMDALLSCVILNIMDIVTTLIDEPKNVQ